MFQVGEVARQLGLNPQTLYFYERIGLIPSPKRTPAGYRLYGHSDLERLAFINHAKTLGLSLEDIKELLMLQEGQQLSCRGVHDRLLKKVQQIDDTIAKLQALRTKLLPLLEQCQQGFEKDQRGEPCVVFQPHTFAALAKTAPQTAENASG